MKIGCANTLPLEEGRLTSTAMKQKQMTKRKTERPNPTHPDRAARWRGARMVGGERHVGRPPSDRVRAISGFSPQSPPPSLKHSAADVRLRLGFVHNDRSAVMTRFLPDIPRQVAYMPVANLRYVKKRRASSRSAFAAVEHEGWAFSPSVRQNANGAGLLPHHWSVT